MANPEIDSLPSNTINDHKVNGHDSSGKERNAWEASGSAAFDFRSMSLLRLVGITEPVFLRRSHHTPS